MSECYVAQVDFQEARNLADLASIHQDLSFVVDGLSRLLRLLQNDDEDTVVQQSLWTAALVAYTRCFATGKRLGLSEDILQTQEWEGDDPIKCHRYYRNLRDKHIAHSVNPFEEVAVGLVLSPPDAQTWQVEGVAVLSRKLMFPSAEGVRTLLNLASCARREIASRAEALTDETLQAGRRFPIDDLLAPTNAEQHPRTR